mgnify:CR=1 FL=1
MLEKLSHNKETRNAIKENLKHVKPNTNLLAGSFRACAPKIWNSLPLWVRKCEAVNSFKNAYDKYQYAKN